MPVVVGNSDDGHASSDAIGETERDSLRGLRVLYVEDEADIAESGRLALESVGVAVELARDFEQGAAAVKRGGVDLMLCDLDLGDDRNGLDLLALLRAAPGGEAIPAVVLSAYGSREDRQASLRAGFIEHLVKPVDAIAIARTLVRALRDVRA